MPAASTPRAVLTLTLLGRRWGGTQLQDEEAKKGLVCLPETNVYLDCHPDGEELLHCFVYHLDIHAPMSSHQCSCFENNMLPSL